MLRVMPAWLMSSTLVFAAATKISSVLAPLTSALVLACLLSPCASPTPEQITTPSQPLASLERLEASQEEVDVPEHADAQQLEASQVVEDPFVVLPQPEPLQRRQDDIVSLDERAAENIRLIAQNGERNEQTFAKMGGSSVEARAYLACLAYDRSCNLSDHAERLAPTLEFFRAGRPNPFLRESEAARVGWSLRSGLMGRPSRLLQEVRFMDARWALAFWGGNDVQGRDPHGFVERLLTLIQQMEVVGTVPILAATTPRLDSAEMDVWARRYNQYSRALADAMRLPYVDFYSALAPLPNRGLARDGVHPNVWIPERTALPCDLSSEGLNHGHNQRNLHTLELLHQARNALHAHAVEESDEQDSTGDGGADSAASSTAQNWLRHDAQEHVSMIPSGLVMRRSSSSLSGYSCDGNQESTGDGEEFLLTFFVAEAMAVDLTVYNVDRANSNFFAYLGVIEPERVGPEFAPSVDSCVVAREDHLQVVLQPGLNVVALELAEPVSSEARDYELPFVLLTEPIPQ